MLRVWCELKTWIKRVVSRLADVAAALGCDRLIERSFVFAIRQMELGRRRRASSKAKGTGPKDIAFEAILNAPDSRVVGVVGFDMGGVEQASRVNFNNLILIDDYFTDYVEPVCALIKEKNFTRCVINGLPNTAPAFYRRLKEVCPSVRVDALFHGSIYQHGVAGEEIEAERYETLLKDAYDDKILDRVGFVKEGIDQIFTRLGYPCFYLPNKIPLPPKSEERETQNPLTLAADSHTGAKIGLFIKKLENRKNPFVQFLAAAALPNVKIFTNIDVSPLAYMRRFSDRFIDCGLITNRNLYYALLKRMTVTAYVSYSECYPMAFVESLACGIPCLTGYTHHILDGEEELSAALIVREIDNPEAVYEALERVIANREHIVELIRDFVPRLRAKNELAWTKFYGPC